MPDAPPRDRSSSAADAAPLMLSVSGARGVVGRSMTPAVAAGFAAAFGSYVRGASGAASPLVCLGRDSRPSGEMLAAAASAGLLATGCRVVDLGVVTTPTVGVMIAERGAEGGLVVTASHNPIAWNGMKCLGADGAAPPKGEAEQIIARFRAGEARYVGPEEIPPAERDGAGTETHVARVLAAVDGEPIRSAALAVVLDSVNGAGGPAARILLERLGCTVTHLNGEPTGRFAHPPEPLEENLGELAAAVPRARAACGFAQDPDADRLALVDETGRCPGEEYTLVLAAKRLLDLGRGGGGVICVNLSTSRMIDDLAARYEGVTVVRTAVGEANVVEAMRAAGALVGGEGNGGVIFPPVCLIRDSLSAMALVLSLLAAASEPLSAIIATLPRYAMIKRKLDMSRLGGPNAVAAAIDRLIPHFGADRCNAADGVRIDLPAGWVHLRPSNTEPIVRLIAEAATEQDAETLLEEVKAAAGW